MNTRLLANQFRSLISAREPEKFSVKTIRKHVWRAADSRRLLRTSPFQDDKPNDGKKMTAVTAKSWVNLMKCKLN